MRPTHLLVPTLTAALAVTAFQVPVADATTAPTSAPASAPAPAAQRAKEPPRQATVTGRGGAVTSVDPYASRIGLRVLKQGGNAVDAAIATAAALGVTEPYSSGIGGGGYFVYYDAKKQKVKTLDGRETAPAATRHDAFIDPATGKPYNFTPELVTSGVSVGVPGTPATWQAALARWGSMSLGETLAPAAALARRGFVVDETFNQQTEDNAERFNTFSSTRRLFLRHGKAPKVGSLFRNPQLADTYDLLAEGGTAAFYRGDLAQEVARTVRKPPVSGRTDLPVPKGRMRPRDLRKYEVVQHQPTQVSYRGLDVYGMPPSSSGGTTVGEALKILERYDLKSLTPAQVEHLEIEAAHLAFADRAKYVGDVSVPTGTLLSDTYAAERACQINPAAAFKPPVAAGNVAAADGSCATPASKGEVAPDTENVSTTNLTVADKDGNVVEYTLTIEQTGGSGIVVPGRGFLLNNELTDFSTVYDPADPNRIEPKKRPRSSMSPTIVLRGGKPLLALGSPGGSTIITTVLGILVDRLDRGLTLEQAIAAPRAAPSNRTPVSAEQGYIDLYGAALTALGHALAPVGAAGTSAAEIGAATAIEFLEGGLVTVAAEPTRRGGGAATVVKPQ
jgi:gamma-glutamyltranspeptidase / glutathione hydrolase